MGLFTLDVTGMMLAMATIITCYSVHLFFMLFVTLTRVLFGLMCTVLSYTYLIVFVAPHVIRTRRGWYLHRKIGQRVSLWRASSVVIQGRRYKQVRYQKQPTSITIHVPYRVCSSACDSHAAWL